jgi:hypothetical protein
MLERCIDPKNKSYPNYGGRGITVCARWFVFELFLEDMGMKPTPEHSLDRINNDGNYEPSNVRWATRKEQAANKRPRKRPPIDTDGFLGLLRTLHGLPPRSKKRERVTLSYAIRMLSHEPKPTK